MREQRVSEDDATRIDATRRVRGRASLVARPSPSTRPTKTRRCVDSKKSFATMRDASTGARLTETRRLRRRRHAAYTNTSGERGVTSSRLPRTAVKLQPSSCTAEACKSSSSAAEALGPSPSRSSDRNLHCIPTQRKGIPLLAWRSRLLRGLPSLLGRFAAHTPVCSR